MYKHKAAKNINKTDNIYKCLLNYLNRNHFQEKQDDLENKVLKKIKTKQITKLK